MTRTATRHQRLLLELERQRETLRAQQERDQRVLQALYAISLACRSRPTLREIFAAVYRELGAVFSFDAFYMAFCDERPGIFKAALLIDEGEQSFIEDIEYGLLTGKIVRAREPLLYRDLVAERDPTAPPVPFGNEQKRSRAWLGVPLMIGPDAVGVISIQSYRVGVFSEAHRDLLQRMANVIAVALENVDLSAAQARLSQALASQVGERDAQLAAMSAISAALVEQRSLAELLDGALEVALGLFGLDAGNVRLLDEAGETLVLAAQRGFGPEYVSVTRRSPLASSPLREVVRLNRPQVVERGWHTRYDPARFPLHLFPKFECSLSVPLALGAAVIGTITLFGFTARPFEPADVSLAQAVANQIAVVVENTRLLEERERQIGELRALGEVSRAASTAQDLATLLRRVHDALQSFIPLDAFAMAIYDGERGVISDGISIDEGHSYTYWRSLPPPPRSLTAHILRTGAALCFRDLPAEIAGLPEIELHPVGSDRVSRSWLGVPLRDRDQRVIGLITVQSYASGVFGTRDEAFLHSVAAQVALHIQNVGLLTQRERQIRELEVIGQIGKLVTASNDLDHMLDEIRRLMVELTEASVFFLLICEPGSRSVTNAIFFEEGSPVALDLIGQPVTPGSLSDWILTQREPLLFQDIASQRDEAARRGIAPRAVGPDNPVRSWAGVPLVARGGALIGVLSLQDYRPYCYDGATIDFLSQVASHISLGVQKVRLFEEREGQIAANQLLFAEAQAHARAAERQAHRIELVHRIASVLSARLDQQEILELASRELAQLFFADHSATVLSLPDGQGVVAAEYPDSGIVGMRLNLRGDPVVDEVERTLRPVVIRDIETDALAAVSRDGWRALGITSLAIIPLVSRERVFGTISLDSYQGPLIFSDDELELMMTVGSAIAAAVENAQLFAAEQDQRRTADTLREMARVLSSSFDPDEVLRLVLEELQKVITCDTASIMLVEGEQLRMVAARGRPGRAIPRSISLPLDGSAAGEVVRRREPLLHSPTGEQGGWMAIPTSADIRAWLGAPLIARGKVLGVLNIDVRGDTDIRFSERDVEVARTFANHAAVAIENAQLYQESVARVEQELEIARRIQSNLFPRELPRIRGLELAARCLPARETGGDFYDLLDLGPRLGVIVGDVSGKSLPAAMLMAVARSTARSEARNHITPWVVLGETNRWLVDDVPHNAFVALSYAVIDPRAGQLSLASGGQLTPLLRRADAGVIFLESPPGLPLGRLPEAEYEQREFELLPGDTLLFYTDGIVEAHDQARQLFGFERLERLFASWGHLPPAELIERILAEVNHFAEGMPTHDDMTLVVVRLA